MKKALLYAVLALSLNVFAQNPQHGLESIGNERDRTGPAQIKTHGIQSLVDFTEAGGNQAYDPGTLIPILDSSYGWQWDTIAPGWMIYVRENNVVYDSKHNLQSYIMKDREGGN